MRAHGTRDDTVGELIRYGIVGTGMMGCEHIRNIRLLPNAVITAIADPVETSLGWADASLGDARPQRFRSAEELAEKGEIDAVVAFLEALSDPGLLTAEELSSPFE